MAENKQIISLIVAISRDNIIGRDNDTPWNHQDDLNHFRNTTFGKAVIMGRTTFKSIGKPLVGRKNIVLTRDTSVRGMAMTDIKATPVHYVNTMNQALECAKGFSDEIVIIGGAEIYNMFMPLVTKIYLSRMDITCYRAGSHHTYLSLDLSSGWQIIDSKAYEANENNDCYCNNETYIRTR